MTLSAVWQLFLTGALPSSIARMRSSSASFPRAYGRGSLPSPLAWSGSIRGAGGRLFSSTTSTSRSIRHHCSGSLRAYPAHFPSRRPRRLTGVPDSAVTYPFFLLD
jgi:hypothetical protein